MKVLVLSDIHDHIWNLKAVLASPVIQDTEALICCGDLCSPFVIPILGSYQKGDVHIVFGNNDADTFRMTAIARAKYSDTIHLHGEYASLELAGKQVAINHFHNIAADIAKARHYDWVFYGHNHLAAHAPMTDSSSHLLNPGTLMGMALGPDGPYKVPATFAVVDLHPEQVQWYQVSEGSESVQSWDLL